MRRRIDPTSFRTVPLCCIEVSAAVRAWLFFESDLTQVGTVDIEWILGGKVIRSQPTSDSYSTHLSYIAAYEEPGITVGGIYSHHKMKLHSKCSRTREPAERHPSNNVNGHVSLPLVMQAVFTIGSDHQLPHASSSQDEVEHMNDMAVISPRCVADIRAGESNVVRLMYTIPHLCLKTLFQPTSNTVGSSCPSCALVCIPCVRSECPKGMTRRRST